MGHKRAETRLSDSLGLANPARAPQRSARQRSGAGGIRTHEALTGLPVFKTGGKNRNRLSFQVFTGDRDADYAQAPTFGDAEPFGDTRLADVVTAWPTLPEAVRAGIAAMVGVATTESKGDR